MVGQQAGPTAKLKSTPLKPTVPQAPQKRSSVKTASVEKRNSMKKEKDPVEIKAQNKQNGQDPHKTQDTCTFKQQDTTYSA